MEQPCFLMPGSLSRASEERPRLVHTPVHRSSHGWLGISAEFPGLLTNAPTNMATQTPFMVTYQVTFRPPSEHNMFNEDVF